MAILAVGIADEGHSVTAVSYALTALQVVTTTTRDTVCRVKAGKARALTSEAVS